MKAVAALVASAALAAFSCAQAADDVLGLEGLIERPLTFSLAELRALPLRDITFPATSGDRARSGGAPHVYRGVALRDLLDRVSLCIRERNAARRMVVAARARDGYAAVFAWMEIYNTPVGEGVFVVVERDGAVLDAAEGPIALVSTRDTSPGPRHVKWLRTIEIGSIEPAWRACPA